MTWTHLENLKENLLLTQDSQGEFGRHTQVWAGLDKAEEMGWPLISGWAAGIRKVPATWKV